jgi:LCP family protein required for cell wall assembly
VFRRRRFRRLSIRRRSPRLFQLKISTALLLVAGFLLSGAFGASAYFLPLVGVARQTGQVQDLATPAAPTSAPPAGGAFTLLLLGSDDDLKFDPNHVLTQSMILVRVDPAAGRVTMLSIPRDLWVPLSVGGTDRIDAAYSYGGAPAAIQTVQRDFHVTVDQYAWIGLKGLIHVIDLLGGVDVPTVNPVMDDYYPADINTTNPYGYYRVAVLPGPQHLDGAHALEYVRSRHSDLRGDFGRSARQQQVLLALRDRARQVHATDLPALASALQGEFKTSMTVAQMAALLPAAGRIQPTDVAQVVLLGDYTQGTVIDNQDVLLPNWSLILPVVHQTFPG